MVNLSTYMFITPLLLNATFFQRLPQYRCVV